ncbi:hypothetical protein AAVH_29780, partial [Aphelenchoides avenae]
DPNAPTKALSAYNFFVEDYCDSNTGSGYKEAALEWNRLKRAANFAELRAPFDRMAEEDKVRYAAELAQYLNGA